MVLPAKADEPPPPLLEEADYVVDLIEGADAEAGIVAPARIGPAAVALFPSRGERHDFGAPLRPAARPARDRHREADFIERKTHRNFARRFVSLVCFVAQP